MNDLEETFDLGLVEVNIRVKLLNVNIFILIPRFEVKNEDSLKRAQLAGIKNAIPFSYSI